MMKKIINSVKARIVAEETRRILNSYQEHIDDLMDRRMYWRDLMNSPVATADDKRLAMEQIAIITNTITDIVKKRSEIIVGSF